MHLFGAEIIESESYFMWVFWATVVAAAVGIVILAVRKRMKRSR